MFHISVGGDIEMFVRSPQKTRFDAGRGVSGAGLQEQGRLPELATQVVVEAEAQEPQSITGLTLNVMSACSVCVWKSLITCAHCGLQACCSGVESQFCFSGLFMCT